MSPALVRSIGVVLTLLTAAYVIASVQAAQTVLSSFLAVCALVQLAGMGALAKNRFSVYARIGILLSASVTLFVFSLWAGHDRGFYHLFLTLATLPLLVIGRRNRWALVACVSVPIVLYILMEVAGSRIMAPISVTPTLVEGLYWVLLPFRFLFLVIGAHYFASTSQKTQARINLTLSELRESVRTSRALLSAIPDMIFRVSDDGRFLDYHCQSEADLFVPPERLVGKKLGEVLPAEIAARLFDCVQDAIAGDQMRLFFFEFEKDGQTRYFDSRIAGTGANDVLMVVQDVSERIAAQKTIFDQQIQVAAASKMAALGEMAGGIAHEINNPLAIISGRAQQLMEMADAGDLEKDMVFRVAEKIDQTAMRISRIIRSLRFFARDGQEDPFEEASVHQIVGDTLEFCRQRFISHAIDLRVKEIPENLFVECRAVQIGQVLLNLLNNAHDAVDAHPEKWIDLAVEELNDRVRLSVMDSGAGVPHEFRDKILESFFTTKDVGKGTGLGLSISKGIVESHHGSIYMDPASSHTRFVIELPKKQNQPARPSRRAEKLEL